MEVMRGCREGCPPGRTTPQPKSGVHLPLAGKKGSGLKRRQQPPAVRGLGPELQPDPLMRLPKGMDVDS